MLKWFLSKCTVYNTHRLTCELVFICYITLRKRGLRFTVYLLKFFRRIFSTTGIEIKQENLNINQCTIPLKTLLIKYMLQTFVIQYLYTLYINRNRLLMNKYGLKWGVVVGFADINEIVSHHCFLCLFIIIYYRWLVFAGMDFI